MACFLNVRPNNGIGVSVIAFCSIVILEGFTHINANKKKKNDKTKNIPVVILSNLGEREDIRRGLDLGATSFLIKASMTVDNIIGEASRILRARKK